MHLKQRHRNAELRRPRAHLGQKPTGQKQRLNFRVINSSMSQMRNDVVETLRYERDLINQYCDNMRSYWDGVIFSNLTQSK